jgi:hypothetical protein
VYDVSKRETFDHINIWLNEIGMLAVLLDCFGVTTCLDIYSTQSEVVKLLVGNKIDKVGTSPFLFFFHFCPLLPAGVAQLSYTRPRERLARRKELRLHESMRCFSWSAVRRLKSAFSKLLMNWYRRYSLPSIQSIDLSLRS